MLKVRSRLSTAHVVAVIALFFAIGGQSVAVGAAKSAAKLITGKQVKDNSLTTADVKDGSLLSQDFKAGQLPAGPAGAPGPRGDSGAQGSKGDTGSRGDTGSKGVGEAHARRQRARVRDNDRRREPAGRRHGERCSRWPAVNVAWAALVIAGASSTASVKLCDASGDHAVGAR